MVHSRRSLPVACAAQPPSQMPAKPPTWCTSITTPNSVPSRATPCCCATSCEVGGSVAMWLAPITGAKAISTAGVGGSTSSAAMPSARTA